MLDSDNSRESGYSDPSFFIGFMVFILIAVITIGMYKQKEAEVKDVQFSSISEIYIEKVQYEGFLTKADKTKLTSELKEKGFENVTIDSTSAKVEKSGEVYLRIVSDEREAFKKGIAK